ncbi:LamG domain-containing protein [Hymenobacter fodinae]|uniref:LamG domain-containing protein n=1 Tax=Hymenobacter fodinae TaxID=2510796 RepID=UPI001436C611|nr:LamG domain-containing protein [Hymenobacter fodinae]
MARSRYFPFVLFPAKGKAASSDNAGSSGLSAEQLAALDLKPSADYNYPTNSADYAIPAGFASFPSSGWIVQRFAITTISTLQALFALHSGNGNNVFGVRFSNTTNRPLFYVRANNVDISTAQFATPNITLPIVANIAQAYGVTWQVNGSALTLRVYWHGQVYEITTTLPAFSAAFTSLRIGARNSGSDPLQGRVASFQLGSGAFLTPAQLSLLCTRPQVTTVATAGQSNIGKWVVGGTDNGGNPDGRNAYLAACANSATRIVTYLGGAIGGAALMKSTVSAGETNYWWDDTTHTPGPNALALSEIIVRYGRQVDEFIWDQGEGEGHAINNPSRPLITSATYKDCLMRLFRYLLSLSPTAEISIGKLGIRTDGTYTNIGGIQAIVDIQNEVIAENVWCRMSHERYDLPLFSDGVHYPKAQYEIMAQRAARQRDRHMGAAITATSGPRFSATRSGATLTINLTHDGATDFTGNGEGFYYMGANGQQVALSGFTKVNGSQITMTLASAVAGTLYYIYDNQPVTLANVIRDNSAYTLPMRRGKVSVA